MRMFSKIVGSIKQGVLVGVVLSWGGALANADHDLLDARQTRIGRAAQTARQAREQAGIEPGKLPIGVFDSGTGGLAVLEAILTIDAFDNRTGQPLPSGDGQPDLAGQAFIYLADQANMPYGNYPNVGRQPFLEDLIIQDVHFLLGNCYYPDEHGPPVHDKLPVRAVVIACNTATAYGKHHIDQLVEASGLNVPVVGVVDAGVRGALDRFADGRSGTIGVLATRATVLADAYPQGIAVEFDRRGWDRRQQRIDVVQQGSLGLAGAIDGAEEFIIHNASSHQPRDDYQGPSFDHPLAPIDPEILPRYALDFRNHGVLFDGPANRPTTLQLNSVMNYLRYDLVTLLETVRRSPDPQPVRAIILACTHFPYLQDAFEQQLQQLFDYQEDGQYIYRDLIAQPVAWIDPAYYTARKLVVRMIDQQQLALNQCPTTSADRTRADFYITVPCRTCPQIELTTQGHFTFDYKYSPDRPSPAGDYRAIPLRLDHLDQESSDRLRQQSPSVWTLLTDFQQIR